MCLYVGWKVGGHRRVLSTSVVPWETECAMNIIIGSATHVVV